MVNEVTLPAGTTLGKSFEYGMDVNLGTHDAPVWAPLRRMFGFGMTPTPQTFDAQTYDDKGAPNADVGGWAFAIAVSTNINRSATTGEYLPEIEALRQRTLPTAKGEAAQVEVRWYHKPETGTPNPTDAGRGYVTVAYSRSNTGPGGETEVWNWTLTGVGSYEVIANPFAGWDVTAPKLTSATPEGAGEGELVTIIGAGFVGVTGAGGVKFGASNADDYVVVSGSTIIASLPAGAAGSAQIVVTSPAGASTALPYTRGA